MVRTVVAVARVVLRVEGPEERSVRDGEHDAHEDEDEDDHPAHPRERDEHGQHAALPVLVTPEEVAPVRLVVVGGMRLAWVRKARSGE